jgi:spore maturation protein CgeB
MFDPQSERLLADRPNLRFRGKADYVTELPRLNRRSKVTLDVVTAHFPNSTTAKIAGCFAAGGLCLFNAKPAFRDAFGADADRVMYRDFDDMNAKIDHLLTHDRERDELAAFFQAGVREKHTFIGLLAEMVAWVRESGAA